MLTLTCLPFRLSPLSQLGLLSQSHGPWLSLLSPPALSLLEGTQCPLRHVTHAALGRRGPFL